MKSIIEIFNTENKTVIRTVDVTGKSKAAVERIQAGLLRVAGAAYSSRVVMA